MVNETVVLALLLEKPKHGYLLLEEADRMIGPNETFDTKRLYTTLRRLEEQGAVSVAQDQSPVKGAPPRKVYTIAPRGFERLRTLVADPKNALDRRRFFLSLSLWFLIAPAARSALVRERLLWLDAEQRHMAEVASLPGHTPWSTAVHTFQRRQIADERRWLLELAKEMGLDAGDD
jgi:DNA-binding PadR family transcriptional regulator